MERARLSITLPTRVGRLLTREVEFARIDAHEWRSIEPCFSAQRRSPFAETVYRFALRLPDADGRPADPVYLSPATHAGVALEARLRERVRAVEISIRRGDGEYRIFGWADDVIPDASPLRNDRPLVISDPRCERCGGLTDGRRRCVDCEARASGMPPVIARAIRLRAAGGSLLFYDTETDGLPEIGDDLRVAGRVPHVWQLAWIIDRERVQVRELAGPPLPRRLARLSGVTPEHATRGADPARVWSEFMDAAKGRTLIAHNGALFDDPIVRASLERHRLFPLAELDHATFDTLPLARALYPSGAEGGPTRHTLGALAAHLGLQASGALHDARVDVVLLRGIFHGLVDEAERRFGGAAEAARLAARVDDPTRSLPTLYGWTRSVCPDCGRRSFGHRPPEERCRACRDAAKPFAATCLDCGETDRLDWEPAARYLCRICREAQPAA